MKNEPWIDKVYKEHLLQPVSSLNMDHWLQAESMIIAQEKRIKDGDGCGSCSSALS